MKSIKFRKKRIVITCFIIFLILLYHETIINQVDKITMPDSSELCKIASDDLLERLRINKDERISDIAKMLNTTNLQNGGKFRAHKLVGSKSKLAIIVPYRDRLVNLELFLKNIHPFLIQQNIYYGIYLVEPIGNLTFNKGISMNAGYLEALKEDNYDCFIFHDVDMVPENPQNYYGCNNLAPKLLASAISAFGYSTEGYFKDKYFGGVTAFTRYQFAHVNGFSNSYYGWGLEDDDARERVLAKYNYISRVSPTVGRYFAHCHEQQHKNPNRFIMYIKSSMIKQESDGLNTIKYEIVSTERNLLFTRFYIRYD